jgi:hypothetical protein
VLRGLLPTSNPATRVSSDNSPTTIELLSGAVALSRSLSTPPCGAGRGHSVWARPPRPS